MSTKTVSITREYDTEGRLIKETTVEVVEPAYVQPYPWTQPWQYPTITYTSASSTTTPNPDYVIRNGS